MGNDRAVAVDPARPVQAPEPGTGALTRALMGLAGASIEWYDFLLYATAAALVFPIMFFPASLPPFVALIASFSTFAVGFLARPVGAILFGHVGDRVGRKTAFALALCMMGTATTVIGCLPSYHAAGAFAPLALALLRFVQGLALGGQWGGAILLATESAPNSKRGLYGSIAQAGVPVGAVLANLAFLIANGAMSPKAFLAYGWRIPFLFSIVLVGLGAFIHFRVEDPGALRESLQREPSVTDPPAYQVSSPAPCAPGQMRGQPSPIFDALRLYPRLIFVAAGAFVSTNLAFYILMTYVVAYGTSAAGLALPRSTMLIPGLITNTAAPAVMFLSGIMSDRYGRRRIFVIGVVLMGVWGFILFPLIETRSFLWITTAIFVGLSLTAWTYAPMAAMFAELFIARVRYTAASLAYQIAAIVGGGLAPITATGLYAKYHSNIWISVYVASACALSLVCVSLLKDKSKTDLEPTPS